MIQNIIRTRNSGAILFIRIMIGSVFLSEGIQKFLFPALRGAGRFESIGLPFPDFLGPFVGVFEITCGILILIGLVTRLASIPLITIMVVAITTTKIPILASDGLWQMLHAARTDWAMLLGGFFLLMKGGGKWSVDQFLMHRGS